MIIVQKSILLRLALHQGAFTLYKYQEVQNYGSLLDDSLNY